jgi:hypothetical protein
MCIAQLQDEEHTRTRYSDTATRLLPSCSSYVLVEAEECERCTTPTLVSVYKHRNASWMALLLL